MVDCVCKAAGEPHFGEGGRSLRHRIASQTCTEEIATVSRASYGRGTAASAEHGACL